MYSSFVPIKKYLSPPYTKLRICDVTCPPRFDRLFCRTTFCLCYRTCLVLRRKQHLSARSRCAPLASVTSGVIAGDDNDVAQQVARALAGAMKDADVRVQVRNAMRSSPFNEHKLVLQEFTGTRAGRRLVQAAAEASGRTERDIDALIAQLPAMDFYAPFAEHRLTWSGGSQVAVGAAIDIDATTFVAYMANGETTSHVSRSGTPEVAWLFIHPAEPKSRRQNPQANTPGSVIQDRNDGTISIQCETCLVDNGDTSGGGGGGSSMILEKFESNIFDGIGSAELRFIVRDANRNELAAARFDGIDPFWGKQHVVNHSFPTGGAYLQLREIDVWDSEDYGTFQIYQTPGWVNATSVDCHGYYLDKTENLEYAKWMCGPSPVSGPIWAAYLR